MAKYPRILLKYTQYDFTVGSTPYMIVYRPLERMAYVYRKEAGAPGMVLIYKNSIAIITLESAMRVLHACLAVLGPADPVKSG